MLHYFEPSVDELAATSPRSTEAYTQRDSIWLSWLSNGHYDTFTHKRVQNAAYDEWLASRQSRLESDAAIANKLHMDGVYESAKCHRDRQEYDSIERTPTSCIENSSNKEPSSVINNFCGEMSDSNSQSYQTGNERAPSPHVYPRSNQRQNSPKSGLHTSQESTSRSNLANFDHDLAVALYNEEFDQLCQHFDIA